MADKQYQGDGLAIRSTPDGARLHCVFQRLEGEATCGGLWLRSTTEGTADECFRVVAVEVGRIDGFGLWRQGTAATPLFDSDWFGAAFADFENVVASGYPPQSKKLPVQGAVLVHDRVARFIRPELTEEYSVSVDGVRQDFIIQKRPSGEGELRVELDVTGATVEPLVNGARLTLRGSGRKLTYSRLHVTDAQGRELTACTKVTRADRITVVVDDGSAVYPVRIDPTFSDENWISLGGIQGANDYVNAAVVDGGGNFYISGEFTLVGDVLANRIAKWDGNSWSALGSGLDSSAQALAVSGSDVYAGGTFTTAGGTAVNRIAKWDGSSWSALGSGMNSGVFALAVSGSELYAGGSFTTADENEANRIAKWDGTNWTAMGAGMDSSVRALAVSGSNVYAGGGFTTAGDIFAMFIAKWDGSSWSSLGSGMNSQVTALAVSGSDVYAGGGFTTAGGTGVNRIAMWDGNNWTALGSGMNSSVSALAVSGSDVYAGGLFITAGGIVHNRIAKWDGSSWSAPGSGMNGSVSALAVSGSDVYVGGSFTTTAGGSGANRIAKWDGNRWSAVGLGMNNSVRKLAVSGNNVYAGGSFTMATNIGGVAVTVNYIAKWDGSNWSALGSGVSDWVTALAVSGSDVYAGGLFGTAGGVSVHRIAKWNGTSWSALGLGMNSFASALAVWGSDVYVGGSFTTVTNIGGMPVRVNSIAKWDGTGWSALGLGMNNSVSALAILGSDVYAGGLFTTATNSGGLPVTVNRIAKWDGSSWSALGTGMPGINHWVNALAILGSDIFAGGVFTTVTNSEGMPVTVNNIAKWDGSSWSALGSGMDNQVQALAVSGNNLFAGGISRRRAEKCQPLPPRRLFRRQPAPPRLLHSRRTRPCSKGRMLRSVSVRVESFPWRINGSKVSHPRPVPPTGLTVSPMC